MSPVSARPSASALPHVRLASVPLAVTLLLTAALTACGGTGGGGIDASSSGEVLLTAREATVIGGTLESVRYRLKDMRWSLMPLAGTNPVLSLRNQDCALTEKNDSLAPTPATGTLPAGTGGSNWRCNLIVYAEENVSTDAVYELMLSGTNEAGQTLGYKRTLRVQPNTALNNIDPDEAYLKDLTIDPVASVCKPGAPIRLQAKGIDTADPGFYYRWRIVAGPVSVITGESTPTLGFITPKTEALTVVELEVSRKPLISDTSTRYKARAVVNSDPGYPYFVCSSEQEPS